MQSMADEDLSDRAILSNLDSNRGIGVQLPNVWIPRNGVAPIKFIQIVRNEYNAWKASEEDKKAREARASQNSDQERNERPTDVASVVQPAVQTAQASLAETIKAQINGLVKRRDYLTDSMARLTEDLDYTGSALDKVHSELELVQRWLKELEDEHTPEVYRASSESISGQVGQRGQSGGEGMGGQDSSSWPTEICYSGNADYSEAPGGVSESDSSRLDK